MQWIKENIMKNILVYTCVLLTLIIVKGCFSIEGFSYGATFIYFLLGLLIIGFYENKLETLEKKLFFTMSILVLILLSTVILKKQVVGYIGIDIIEPIQKINTMISKNLKTEFSLYRHIFLIVIPILTSLYYLIINKKYTAYILIGNYVFLLIYWLLNYRIEVNSLVFRVTLLSFIILGLDNIERTRCYIKGRGLRNSLSNSKVILWLITISLVMSLFIVILPKSKAGKYSVEIDNKVGELFSNGTAYSQEKIKNNIYNMAKSGYSDSEKRLGGPVNINHSEAFKVRGVDYKNTIYFRAGVKAMYTGDRWTDEVAQLELGGITNYTSIIDKLSALGAAQRDIYVYPDYIETTTLFSPNYSSEVLLNIKEQNEVYIDKQTNMFYGKKKVYEPYNIKYIDYNWINKNINDIEFSKEIGTASYTLRNEKYLELPDTITDRTKALAYEIVKGANTNYEKSIKIRDYLTKNYNYETDMDEVPKGCDFVDYFLFEEKKGYCVYFASAFTILNRIVGVPTRYLEGFKLSEFKKDRILSDGRVLITNEDAHAWSEVLMKVDEKSNYLRGEDIWLQMDTSPTPYEEKNRIIKDDDINKNEVKEDGFKDIKQSEKTKEVISDTNNIEERTIDKGQIVWIIVILIVIIYFIIKEFIKKNKVKKIKNSKSISLFYEHTLKCLKKIKIEKENHKTDLEFAKAIEDKELSIRMIELVEVFYEERYGKKTVEYDKDEFLKYLQEYLKHTQGKLRYYLKRIFT